MGLVLLSDALLLAGKCDKVLRCAEMSRKETACHYEEGSSAPDAPTLRRSGCSYKHANNFRDVNLTFDASNIPLHHQHRHRHSLPGLRPIYIDNDVASQGAQYFA